MFAAWMSKGMIPDCMNTALMKLLPKSENGLDDLTKVRPIALMETIVKIFERLLIGRIVRILVDQDVLETGQYGGLPGLGVQSPLRMLAEMIEDANCTNQEMYILITDLSKAFDTMEYWSQAMSWTCLGVPQHMVNLLVSLDRGSLSGNGATTRVGLAQGRRSDPFRHGRGVRQGSVGGPIKWCVFVNFWIKWVKTRMTGKGYQMSANKAARRIDEYMNEEEKDLAQAEHIASKFIDDATWTTHTPMDMQEIVNMCQTFCEFHGVALNKSKSELYAINPKIGRSPIKWRETESIVGPDGEERQQDIPIPIRRDPIKSLGVWFDLDSSWKTQIGATTAKLRELLSKIRFTSAPAPILRHGINIKVIPTIAYPLQVAPVDYGTLSKWDVMIREAFRSATLTDEHG